MRERVSGDHECEVPPARGECQRLAGAEIELREVQRKAEFAQRARAEIMVAHARSAREQQHIPALDVGAADRAHELRGIVADSELMRDLRTSLGGERGDERGIAVADFSGFGNLVGRDEFAACRDV